MVSRLPWLVVVEICLLDLVVVLLLLLIHPDCCGLVTLVVVVVVLSKWERLVFPPLSLAEVSSVGGTTGSSSG